MPNNLQISNKVTIIIWQEKKDHFSNRGKSGHVALATRGFENLPLKQQNSLEQQNSQDAGCYLSYTTYAVKLKKYFLDRFEEAFEMRRWGFVPLLNFFNTPKPKGRLEEEKYGKTPYQRDCTRYGDNPIRIDFYDLDVAAIEEEDKRIKQMVEQKKLNFNLIRFLTDITAFVDKSHEYLLNIRHLTTLTEWQMSCKQYQEKEFLLAYVNEENAWYFFGKRANGQILKDKLSNIEALEFTWNTLSKTSVESAHQKNQELLNIVLADLNYCEPFNCCTFVLYLLDIGLHKKGGIKKVLKVNKIEDIYRLPQFQVNKLSVYNFNSKLLAFAGFSTVTFFGVALFSWIKQKMVAQKNLEVLKIYARAMLEGYKKETDVVANEARRCVEIAHHDLGMSGLLVTSLTSWAAIGATSKLLTLITPEKVHMIATMLAESEKKHLEDTELKSLDLHI